MHLGLNGHLTRSDAACLDPADRGLLLGDGLFETMRAAGGRVPLLWRHLARLREGARVLGLPGARRGYRPGRSGFAGQPTSLPMPPFASFQLPTSGRWECEAGAECDVGQA